MCMLWYACLLVDVHAMCMLFTGGCARYGMPVYWWMCTLWYACLLVDVHAMGMSFIAEAARCIIRVMAWQIFMPRVAVYL